MTASGAETVTPPGRAVSTSGYAFCGLSVLLLACQIWLIGVWLAAVAASSTQSERVGYFLAHLPVALGRLGAFDVTALSVTIGTVGAVAGVLAVRLLRDAGRRWSIGLAVANGVLVLWYLFTMM